VLGRYLNSVDARLAALESEVRGLRQAALNRNRASANPEIRRTELNGNDEATSGSIENTSTSIAVDDVHQDGISPDATDGTGTIEFTSEEDCAHFGQWWKRLLGSFVADFHAAGASSNIAFIRSIRASIAASINERGHMGLTRHHQRATEARNPEQLRLSVSRPPSPAPAHSVPSTINGISRDAFWLPPEREVLRLCRQYFADTGMLFPYVHESSFWEYYEVVRASRFKRVRASWLGLLNMIMAMASTTEWQNDTDDASQSLSSEKFFLRAKALCLDPTRVGASLEVGKLAALDSFCEDQN
jgi:hypothetical protein